MLRINFKNADKFSKALFAAIAVALTLLMPHAVHAQDAADLLVRVNRLENQLRTLSGQLEQAQFENRKLQEQLKRFQEDVEFRFQDMKGGKAGGAKNQPNSAPQPPQQQRRGDAFDPSTQNSSVQNLNTQNLTTNMQNQNTRRPVSGLPNAIFEDEGFDEQADVGLSNTGRSGGTRGEGALSPQGLSPQQGFPPPMQAQQNFSQPRAMQQTPPIAPANIASNDANQLYENAYAYLLQKEYSASENGFRQFLRAHPRHALNADATYWLGETYAQRNRHREAAEQFLKITTDYPQAAKAPDATLKLGISLNALGAKDQACATLAKAERDFANRGDAFKKRVDQEQKRIKCA